MSDDAITAEPIAAYPPLEKDGMAFAHRGTLTTGLVYYGTITRIRQIQPMRYKRAQPIGAQPLYSAI